MTFTIEKIDGEIEHVEDSFIETYIALIDKRTVKKLTYPNGDTEFNDDHY